MESLELTFRNKTALVTGATGLVGGWLVHELLATGAKVVCLIQDVDPQSEFGLSNLASKVVCVPGRLQEDALLERVINYYEPSFVFHLGAQTLVQPALRLPVETLESNVRGTYLLLEAIRRISCVESVVIASSDKAYGTLTREKYLESDSLAGEHPYDVSKSCTDLISRMYFVTYQLPITIARCGNIYGGGDVNWSRIVPGTIRSLMRGERPILRSDGTLVRDYLHVKDVVRAYMLLAARGCETGIAGEAFNFAAGEELTALQVVDRLRRLMDCEIIEPRILAETRSEIPKQILDWTKAREILKWAPTLDFESGLREAIAWYARIL